jgi:hypothetical protein
MTTRAVSRRTALKTLGGSAGALALLPWLSEEGLLAFEKVQATKAPPLLKVLSAGQYATVEALVEALIPADERSPGAKEARVADYIDLLLNEASTPLRQQWLAGLSALDAESSKRFNAPFVKLKAAQAEALLTDISQFEQAKPPSAPKVADPALDIPRQEQTQPKPPQVDTLLGDVGRHKVERSPLETFFANTKQATIHGYYTSEIGIHKELRYKGNQVIAEFVGCVTNEGKDCPHCGRKARA